MKGQKKTPQVFIKMMMAFIKTNVEKSTIPCLVIAYHLFKCFLGEYF
jgi:hypothetical protein